MTRSCEVCGKEFPHVHRGSLKHCSNECRSEARRARDRERPRPKGRARVGTTRLDAAVRALRSDPELENWQLRERGYDSVVIAKARKAVGIPAPLGVSEPLTTALREAAPETYHGDAWANLRWLRS